MKPAMQKKIVCLLATLLILAAGCSEAAKPAKTVKTIVFITNTASNFWKIAQKGCEKADAELADVNVIVKTAFGSTVKEQERYINECFTKDDADAIAISPIDPVGMKDMLDKAAKRTLLITQDSDAPQSARRFYIGADNREAGRKAGELMKKALPKGGKVMVFVGKELENAQERLAGIREALAGSKVEILGLMLDDNDVTKAKENGIEAIEKNPDLAGMIGLWSYNGPAIIHAVQNKDMVGKIKIVCFDDDKETLDGIKDGTIFGTVAQQPFEYGYESVQILNKVLKGDESVIPENKKIYIPTVVVQKDNLEEHRGKMEKLIGS